MKKICVLASGGDAPGMNACMEAIFLRGSELGYDVWVAVSGYDGLVKGQVAKLTPQNACGISNKSGCVFKCARSPLFMTRDGFNSAVTNIKKYGFEAVIVIGGNGSFCGAGSLKVAGIPVIAIPATIDNDVFITKHNLGFSSACESAVQLIDALKTTMETNDRDHIVQLMGRHCIQLSYMVGMATFADIIDMEGQRNTPAEMAKLIASKRKSGKSSVYMLMQERKGTDAVSEAVNSAQYLKDLWALSGNANTRMNTLGHLQRGAPPSCRDRYLGVVYGQAALDCVVNKRFGVGLGLVNDQVSCIDIDPMPLP